MNIKEGLEMFLNYTFRGRTLDTNEEISTIIAEIDKIYGVKSDYRFTQFNTRTMTAHLIIIIYAHKLHMDIEYVNHNGHSTIVSAKLINPLI